MLIFFVLWLSLFLLRGAAYVWGSGLTFVGQERQGVVGIMLVTLEVDIAFEISVNCKKDKGDLFLPLLFSFVLGTSALIAYGICCWFKLL